MVHALSLGLHGSHGGAGLHGFHGWHGLHALHHLHGLHCLLGLHGLLGLHLGLPGLVVGPQRFCSRCGGLLGGSPCLETAPCGKQKSGGTGLFGKNTVWIKIAFGHRSGSGKSPAWSIPHGLSSQLAKTIGSTWGLASPSQTGC